MSAPAVGTEVWTTSGRTGVVVEPRTSQQDSARVTVRWHESQFDREVLISTLSWDVEEPEAPQVGSARLCFALCGHHPEYLVSNPATPLVSPLETCSAHLGDLLGNLAKAALRTPGVSVVRPEVLRLTPQV